MSPERAYGILFSSRIVFDRADGLHRFGGNSRAARCGFIAALQLSGSLRGAKTRRDLERGWLKFDALRASGRLDLEQWTAESKRIRERLFPEETLTGGRGRR
jgi:hypothetical protein